ncbi:hypothetical protein AB4118_25515, partial [Bosea sp. 2RAB26]
MGVLTGRAPKPGLGGTRKGMVPGEAEPAREFADAAPFERRSVQRETRALQPASTDIVRPPAQWREQAIQRRARQPEGAAQHGRIARRVSDAAVAYALTLPGAGISTSYGMPAVKVKGRAFLSPGHEAGSFCIAIDRDTVT